ncbi:hypothetical protein S83_019345, partial [Arachis hypogaea]
DNNFSGNILNWMDKLSRLRIPFLEKNKIYRRIAVQLCKLNHVIIMNLSSNMINDLIPSFLTNLSFGMERFNDDDDDATHFEIQTKFIKSIVLPELKYS